MPCSLPAPSTADALDAGDNSTLADLRTQFLALDTNADGLVAPAEFDSELADYLPYGNSTDTAAPVSGCWVVPWQAGCGMAGAAERRKPGAARQYVALRPRACCVLMKAHTPACRLWCARPPAQSPAVEPVPSPIPVMPATATSAGSRSRLFATGAAVVTALLAFINA